MNILLIIAYSLLAVLAVWAAYWFFKDPGHFLLLDNKYRMMVKIRECYLKGLKAQPQDSEDYFMRKATKIINDYKPVFGPIEVKTDLKFQKETVAKMLSRKEYYEYYFFQDRFNLQLFHQMYEDYRSGISETFPYNQESKLFSVLPEAISRNKTLVNDISKFIEAGWLDENGMPKPNIQTQRLALAAYTMCNHAGVKRYDAIFGSYWKIKPETIRTSKVHALDSKDGGTMQIEIEEILNISHKVGAD